MFEGERARRGEGERIGSVGNTALKYAV